MAGPLRLLYVSPDPASSDRPGRRLGFEPADVDVRTARTVGAGLDRLGPAVDYLVVDPAVGDAGVADLLEAARQAVVVAVVLEGAGIGGAGAGTDAADATDASQSAGTDAATESGPSASPRRMTAASGPAYLQTVAESVPDGIVTIDADSVIQTANPGMETLFGYAPEELVGQSLTTIIPERLRDRHIEAIDAYLERGERSFDWSGIELPGLHRDGHEIPLSISFSEFERDGERFFAGVMRDISQRRAYEARLERQNRRLEEFASFVSHDLRTPLDEAALHLEMGGKHLDDSAAAAHLEGVADAHDRMRRLVDDLLSYARAGQEAVDPEPVDLGELATMTWGAIGPVGDTLHADVECRVRADPGLLRQVLDNLLRNAVEHGSTSPASQTQQDAGEHGSREPSAADRADADAASDPGPGSDAADASGAVGVTVWVGELDDGFYVADDGPGIPPEEREAVFEPGHSTVADGTGFGLAIVRDVATAHDWTVAATESDAGGARFEVTGVVVDR